MIILAAQIMLYGISYIGDKENEVFIEIPAYSEEQAKYFLGIEDEKIIDIECVVKRYATH